MKLGDILPVKPIAKKGIFSVCPFIMPIHRTLDVGVVLLQPIFSLLLFDPNIPAPRCLRGKQHCVASNSTSVTLDPMPFSKGDVT